MPLVISKEYPGQKDPAAAAALPRPPPPPYSRTRAGEPSRGAKAAECAASGCVLCVCCPLAVLWCLAKIPFKAARAAAERAGRCLCLDKPRHRRILEAASSFSDLEDDWTPAAHPRRYLRPGR